MGHRLFDVCDNDFTSLAIRARTYLDGTQAMNFIVKQESCAIAKMTARCALYK